MLPLQFDTKEKAGQFCLGCLNFGTRTDKDTSFALLDCFTESGGSFLDTSNNYAFWNPGARGGESEALLGEWFRSRKNRDNIFLATKAGAMPLDLAKGFDNMEGLSRKALLAAADASLRRLGTDYIDLYYAHIDDAAVPLNETLRTLDDLVKLGKVRYIGCSNYTFGRLTEALSVSEREGLASYCCIQQRYTYFQPVIGADFGVQEAADRRLLSYCAQNMNFRLLAYSPLLNGGYTDKKRLPSEYAGEQNLKRMEILRVVAEEQNATINQVVLAWLVQSQPRAIPLVAASRIDQLKENLGAADVILTENQLERMEQQ